MKDRSISKKCQVNIEIDEMHRLETKYNAIIRLRYSVGCQILCNFIK